LAQKFINCVFSTYDIGVCMKIKDHSKIIIRLLFYKPKRKTGLLTVLPPSHKLLLPAKKTATTGKTHLSPWLRTSTLCLIVRRATNRAIYTFLKWRICRHECNVQQNRRLQDQQEDANRRLPRLLVPRAVSPGFLSDGLHHSQIWRK